MPGESEIRTTSVAESPAPAGEVARRRKGRGKGPRLHGRPSLPELASRKQPLPLWVWGVAILLAAWGASSANPLLTPAAILMLPVLTSLLWLRGEPPVLLFACAMQWVQATAAIFYTNVKGVPLSVEWEFGGAEIVKATWLSMAGVLVLAAGMRLALLRRKGGGAGQVQGEIARLQSGRICPLYLAAFLFFSLVESLAFRISALTQPLLAVTTLRWVLVFLLAYAVFTQRRQYALLAVVVSLEFFTGLLGFFSSFKNVLFVLLVALPSAPHFFRGTRLLQFSLVAVAVLVVGIVWTAIKGDYREFLNQGTGQQVVLAPVDQRVEKLGELLNGLNREKLESGWEDMILRSSYVKYFGQTIANVPSSLPYENGALWSGAVKHVLMPRFLFPNKAALDDSARASYYTGVEVAGADQGTSIGIGYMGESYIDFGPIGMFAPILFLGLFYGFIYRFFVYHHPVKVLGFAMATAILIFGAYTIETSNVKLIGGNLMGLIVMGLFAKVAGAWLWRQITSQPVRIGGGRRKQRSKSTEPPGSTMP